MSVKWIRSKRWDEENLTGPLAPVKWVLRALSSVPLAIVLLTLVALYGVLASVPIGLIALAPTYAIYALTLLACLGVGMLIPMVLAGRMLRKAGAPPAARFAISLFGGLALTVVVVGIWYALAWPIMRYSPAIESVAGSRATGFRLFASFVDQYKSVQVRRLPGMELSELEFYSWWPLRLVLLLFVINMITATVRRIEFVFVNLGVLTVHAGIVTIALGSVLYSTLKLEGDMLLMAGPVDAQGVPAAGAPTDGFYDNTRLAMWVTQREGLGWEQRPIVGLPRYNDYNLDAIGGVRSAADGPVGREPIDVALPGLTPTIGAGVGATPLVDGDVGIRIVGYGSYTMLSERWVSAAKVGLEGTAGSPMRELEAYLSIPDPTTGRVPAEPQKSYRLLPDVPQERVDILDVLGVEYVRGMDPVRWSDLTTALPRGTQHALVVEHPASGFRGVFPVRPGTRIPVGGSGYALEVKDLHANAPFPIITRGYEGAQSSVAVVRVLPPAVDGGVGVGGGGGAFDRWVYHRFPEISQDMLDEVNERGMPRRRDASPAIRIAYIDASMIQVYFDEDRATGVARAIVRTPDSVNVTEGLADGDAVRVLPSLRLQLSGRVEDAVRVEAPVVVPDGQQDKSQVGTHRQAAVAVEVSVPDKSPLGGTSTAWKTTIWVPFTQYLEVSGDTRRTVVLPDGRRVTLAFGRVRHALPMALRLTDFEMTPYPHSQTPRDFRSELVVMSRWNGVYKDEPRRTSLNEPLLVRVPFQARDGESAIRRTARRLLRAIAPEQYKFSQAGWDQEGWRQTTALAESGEVPRPFARFTILGVGNNPGIYIIATGAVMMSVGIPWAFYIKPLLVRRKKKKIQEALARGDWPKVKKPRGGAVNGTADLLVESVEGRVSGGGA